MDLITNTRKMYYTKLSLDTILNLRNSEFKTFYYIVASSKSKDGTCKIGYQNLTKLMNLKSPASVNTTISKLTKMGYIKVIKGTGLNGSRGINMSGYRSKSYRPIDQTNTNYVIIHDHLLTLASGRIFNHKSLTGEQLRFLLLLNANELQDSNAFILNDTMEDTLLFFGFSLAMQKKHLRILTKKGYILQNGCRTYKLISSYWHINKKREELINYWNEICHFYVPLNKVDLDSNTYLNEPIEALINQYPTLQNRNVSLIDRTSTKEYDTAKSIFSLLILLCEGNICNIEYLIIYYLWLPLKQHHWKHFGNFSVIDYLLSTYNDFSTVCNAIQTADYNNSIDKALVISTYKSLKARANKLSTLID